MSDSPIDNKDSLPKIEDCENYTENDATTYLSQVIVELEKFIVPFDSSSIYELMVRISTSYFAYKPFRDRIGEFFVSRNLFKPLHYFLKQMSKSLDVTDETLEICLTLLINFSDCSEIFTKGLFASKIPKLMIDNCLSDVFISDLSTDVNVEFVSNSVMVLHNILRDPNNTINHRMSEFKSFLLKCIQIDDNSQLGVLSLLTLSYLVDEKDVKLLDEGSDTIKKLISKIKYASDHGTGSGGFSIRELIYGLRCISCNDNMKKKIHDEGGIPILIDILSKSDGPEREPILGTIESLCFNEEIKIILKEIFKIEEVIKPFENDSDEKLKRHYDGIMWKLHNKKESYHKKTTETQKVSKKDSKPFDVFISYSWANRNKILTIVENLKKCNIRAWLDEEQMRGSSIEAMANGIENSSLFIIAISPAYKKSINCRDEAEYAKFIQKPIIPLIMELKYKPNGWLGFIMGSKVYFEFSERRNTEEEIQRLLESIQVILESNDSSFSYFESQTEARECFQEISKMVGNELSETVRNWTNEDVAKWLTDCKLEYLKKRFGKVTGSLISVMLKLRANSPEYFNGTLKNEFKMNFVDVLVFHKALDDLVSVH